MNPFEHEKITNPFNSSYRSSSPSISSFDPNWFDFKKKPDVMKRLPNKRPPTTDHQLIVKNNIRVCAVEIPFIATSFSQIRIWNYATGDNVKQINLGDLKCSSMLFLDHKSGGYRLWVGIGSEIWDIGIPSGEIIERIY